VAQFRPILIALIASISFTAVAVILWGLAIAWAAECLTPAAAPLDRSAAVAVTVLAGLGWALVAVLRWAVKELRAAERDRAALIRTLAAVAPASAATLRPTRPHGQPGRRVPE
jgi:hypothetical protein